MIERALFLACVVAFFCVAPVRGQSLDVYGPRAAFASTVDPRAGSGCRGAAIAQPLALQDVILHAVCANPLARQAWANARVQAAVVGIAQSAYVPALNVVTGIERDTLRTTYDVTGAGDVDVGQASSSRYALVNLSLVLFDFGKRSSALRQARQLLIAADASQDEVLQTVVLQVAQAYYELRDAEAGVDAAREIEAIDQQSVTQATARHEAGTGTLSDELQAQTSYQRAVLDHANAEGGVLAARGRLAAAMGLDADTPVQIVASPSESELDSIVSSFSQEVDQLINQAKQSRPDLVAARARLQAARADIDAARATGRPTVALVGSFAQNNPSYRQQPQGLGAATIAGSRAATIGLQVTIPLSEGVASRYRIAQAQAHADAQEADLQAAELQAALEVWESYQSLKVDTANLANSQELLMDARRSLEVARGRYTAGVGSFVELANAQTALADARKRRVMAISDWHAARLKLAASLGDLGKWRTP